MDLTRTARTIIPIRLTMLPKIPDCVIDREKAIISGEGVMLAERGHGESKFSDNPVNEKAVNPFELTAGRRARRHKDAIFL